MNPFFGGHTKKGSLWEKIFWQKQGHVETPDIPGQNSHLWRSVDGATC